MKEILIEKVLLIACERLKGIDVKGLKEILFNVFDEVECIEKKDVDQCDNKMYIEQFIAAKKVEGCSEKSLDYYLNTLNAMDKEIRKPITNIITDDLRKYLSDYQEKRGTSKVTIDNLRRILSSFFGWLEDEDYIVKSPVRRIHKVKTGKVIKETYTDEELEKMKDNCKEIRDLAIIELLSSTGMRIGELVNLDKKDINFSERQCIVKGKGDSEREVYFDARTKLSLLKYLSTRDDEEDALFLSLRGKRRMKINSIEKRLKQLGVALNINKLHPHKFRRTLATVAIDKGMPIEQVQKLLGHVRIDTTMHYAMVNQANVKFT